MSSPIKNVIIIGAGGNLGTHILPALLATPSLKISVLSRASSKSTFPSTANVITVPDSYPEHAVIEAFKPQDAIIDLAPLTEIPQHKAFIDAAVKAGVKRFIPSEFGNKTSEPRNVEAVPVFACKVAVRDHLISKEHTGLTWTGVINGLFFDWGLQTGFAGFDLKTHKATLYDEGKAPADLSLRSTIGKAVAAILSDPHAYAESKNRYVAINSFHVSQLDILAALEKATGKTWEREYTSSTEASRVGKEKLSKGDFSGFVPAILGLEWGGNEWAHENGADNGLLGLKTGSSKELEEAVRKIVAGEDV